jgi:peptidoglycan/LPS O-acetylase OafA/YrhL
LISRNIFGLNQINQLTFTRFVAAFFVFVFHFGKDTIFFELPFISTLSRHGNIGVLYFFVLSGFILTYVYHNERQQDTEFLEFIINRLSRIYPLYLFALILFILIVLVLQDQRVSIYDVTLSLFLIQSWIPGKELTLNFPGWSLSVEMFFYFAFPFLNSYWLKKKFSVVILWILIVWIIIQIIFTAARVIYGKNFPGLDYNPFFHFGTFLLGCAAGLIYVRKQEWLNKHYRFLNLLFFVALLLVLVMLNFKIASIYQYRLFAPSFAIIILWLAQNDNTLTRIFSKSKLIYLGEISFGFYILQYPAKFLVRYLNDYLHIPHFEQCEFYFHFIFLVVMSILTFHFLENPMKFFIRNIVGRKS